MAAVFMLLDVLLVERIEKAGPAAAGVELGFRGKELETTGGAKIDAGTLDIGILAGEGTLGALLSQNAVLLGRERTAPFLI
jgi:hypothetical protein